MGDSTPHRARVGLVLDRVAPVLVAATAAASSSSLSFDADMQALAVGRLVSNFEGYADDHIVDELHERVLERALDDDAYASSDVALLRARDALRAYDSAAVAVLEAYPTFRSVLHQRTTLGLFQLTDWLWRNDTHVRALCDMEGISLQKVPATQPTTPDQHAIVRAECARLRSTACSLQHSAKRLRARASALESAVVDGVKTAAAAAAGQGGGDDVLGFKLLLHGRALTEFPYTAIPVRAGQSLTLRIPACFTPSLTGFDPTTSFDLACLNATEYFPNDLPRDDMMFVDLCAPTTAGRFYLLDQTSRQITAQLAGAHLHVLDARDGTDATALCATVERVLQKRPRS
jgi:hypothetical protein